MNKIVTIIGPTASGKTSLAIRLAKKLNAEVIGLDSRQIYKGMKIGTAQPSKIEMAGINHHLIGFQDPAKPISAGEYGAMVKETIKDIQGNGKIPIICGGAGLYYRAISKGIFKESVSNLPIRGRLEKLYDDNPILLTERLKKIDPKYSEIVHINNKKRLIRALEIFEATGKSPSEHFQNQKSKFSNQLNLFTILLNWERDDLNNRIVKRTKKMFKDGWINEAKLLFEAQEKGGTVFPALDSIGYRQIFHHLKGTMTFEEVYEDIIIKTRQFSRRQIQWFKKEPIDLFIDMNNIGCEKLDEILYCFLIPLI